MKRMPLARNTPLSHGDTTLKRTPLQPGKRKQRQRIPPNVRQRVFARSKRKCIVCHRRVRLQVHHCLPVREFPALELVAENMVGVCEGCHDNHERAHRRITWAELPPCVITLAHSTSGAAVMFLERTHPR